MAKDKGIATLFLMHGLTQKSNGSILYHKFISYFIVNILTANKKKNKNVCINIGIKLNKII